MLQTNNQAVTNPREQNLLNIRRRTSLGNTSCESQDKPNSSKSEEVKLTTDHSNAMDVDNDCLGSGDANTNKNQYEEKEAEKDPKITKELEIKMLYLSFLMRAKILTMGTDVWKTKAKFTDEIAAIILDINKHIKTAEDAWFYSKFQDTDDNLKNAENLYDETNVIFQTVSVESNTQTKKNQRDIEASYVKYKVTVRGDERDVMKCIQLAEDSLSKGNIKRAERLLHKAERICPTKNARELLKKVEAAKSAAEAETAKEAVTEHKEEANENSSSNTQEPTTKEFDLHSKKAISDETKEAESKKESTEKITKTTEPALKKENIIYAFMENIIAVGWRGTKPNEINQDEQKSVKAHILDSKMAHKSSYSIPCDKIEAKKCETAAKEAIENKDFNKAKKLLQKAQWMDKSIDVTVMLKQVECELFAINTPKESNKEIEYKSHTTNESRYRGTHTYPNNNNLAEEKLKNSKDKITANKATETPKTEIGIQNKQSHDYSVQNPANEKYDTDNKVSNKNSYAAVVAKPSHEHSTSEDQFALSPGKTATPSYHQSNYKDEAEDYFKKAQMANTKKSFDEAEMYALKSEQLNPSVRAKALLDDINLSRNLYYSRLRSGTVYKTSHQSPPKHSKLKEKAEKFVEEAEEAYRDGKIEEAELLLRKSESLNPTKRATVLSELIQDAKHNPEIIENVKKEKAMKYVKEAQELFSTGDIDAAENLLVEADSIFSDKKIQNFLERIRHEKAMRNAKELQSKLELKPEEKFDQREQEAMKCVNKAQTAMSEKNIEKAERLLTKAMRLYPLKTTQDFLKTVIIAKEQKINEEAEAAVNAAKSAKEQKINEDAGAASVAQSPSEKGLHEKLTLVNQFVDSGIQAYNENKYYAAKEWFQKANNVYTTYLAIEYLLMIEKQLPSSSKNKANQKKEREIIDEQDIYLTIADEDLKNKKFDEAVSNVFKAENLRLTVKGFEMLQRILEAEFYEKHGGRTKMTRSNYEPKLKDGLRMFKAKRFLDIGEQAFDCRNFRMAEFYFRKSSDMFPTVKAKSLRMEAEQAMRNMNAPESCVCKFVKGIKSFLTL